MSKARFPKDLPSLQAAAIASKERLRRREAAMSVEKKLAAVEIMMRQINPLMPSKVRRQAMLDSSWYGRNAPRGGHA